MEHLVSLRQTALIRSCSHHQEWICQTNEFQANISPLQPCCEQLQEVPEPLSHPQSTNKPGLSWPANHSHRIFWINRHQGYQCPPEEAGKHSQLLRYCAPLLDTIPGVKETFSLLGCFRFSNSPELCSPNPFPGFLRACKTQSHEVPLNREELKHCSLCSNPFPSVCAHLLLKI